MMRARGATVVLFLAFACGSKATPLPKLSEQVPVVADVRTLLPPVVAAPRVLVLISPDGKLAVADAPEGPDAWNVLSTKPPRSRGEPVHRDVIAAMVREAVVRRRKIEPQAKDLAGAGVNDTALVEETTVNPDDDDPPPPPEEDEADDGADESGGTGTTILLEEGKMGKKDSDRSAGSYNMKGPGDDPQLARQQALDAAQAAGIVGLVADHGGGGMSGGFGFGRSGFGPGSAPDAAMPSRVTKVAGRRAAPEDDPAGTLIVAAPSARAAPVVDLIGELDSTFVAVDHQGQLRALRVGFNLRQRDRSLSLSELRAPSARWVEVRIGADALTIEAVPSPSVTVPWAAGALDVAALTKAYSEARTALGDVERLDVDVLVGADTDMQRLVDVVAALDAAGAQVIALGDIPAADSPEAGKRGKRIIRATIGQPQAVGDLDKAVIRRHIQAELPKIKACYEQALLTNPSLSGTVSTQFFISPSGAVAVANASGLDAEVASCVAAVIKATEFPKPKGGGGVQVNYPFTFRN